MLQSKIKAGERDREIIFIQPIKEQGVSNEDKITGWEEIDDHPDDNAKKIESGGSTVVQADRVVLIQSVMWNIRWRDDLNVTMRLVWDTKVYEIVNISEPDSERRRSLNITTNLLDNVYFT